MIGATLGNCVHVAGIMNFFNLAEREGIDTEFLGTGLSIDNLIGNIIEENPDMVAVSFRLNPELLEPILDNLINSLKEVNENLNDIEWIFGGTFDNAVIAKKYNFFNKVFDSTENMYDTMAYLRGNEIKENKKHETNLIDRINSKYPYPILRHHLGLESVEITAKAIEKIADSEVLDVISIALDQNAQEFFFDQENMDKKLDGAGGVPVRREDDLIKLYEASQRGNYPLLRSYSGTKNILSFSQVLQDTIKNAWCAIPIFWYSELDGRSKRDLEKAIEENQKVMKWHGDRNIPVESNDPHQWGLRDSHDAISVADAYIVAYNAKKMGVKDYIAQFMFNTPPSLSPKKDLAKMLAMIELMSHLEDDNFKVYRQARAGLSSFPTDLDQAKGQLASSAYLALNIKPHIYHVVSYSEAQYAAGADEVIESCKIVRGVINNSFLGSVDMTKDIEVQKRKKELIKDAIVIIKAIESIGKDSCDPLSDPRVLTHSVKLGILDAPHLKGNIVAPGKLQTRIIDGASYAYDIKNKKVLTEEERISRILGSI